MKDHTPENSPLGKESQYPSHYAPELLFPISRSDNRAAMGIGKELPFFGIDSWTAFEVSWLNKRGKPLVAIAEITIPCESPNIIESKSLKLYFNSLNQSTFDSRESLVETLEKDLSAAAGARVDIALSGMAAENGSFADVGEYECIDELDIDADQYQPDAGLLRVQEDYQAEEQLVSHLLKSNCPVTGQPDWASLFIQYRGPQIDHEALLKYIISFREHTGFHEQCVEQIFTDLISRCKPQSLTVNARFLRRGGLDINPVRSTDQQYPLIKRVLRQ